MNLCYCVQQNSRKNKENMRMNIWDNNLRTASLDLKFTDFYKKNAGYLQTDTGSHLEQKDSEELVIQISKKLYLIIFISLI